MIQSGCSNPKYSQNCVTYMEKQTSIYLLPDSITSCQFTTRTNLTLRHTLWMPEQGIREQTLIIFSPFSLMGRVLKQMRTDQAEAIVVSPLWPTQVWFAAALGMVIDTPLILPLNCLILPQDPTLKHPLKNLRMIAL